MPELLRIKGLTLVDNDGKERGLIRLLSGDATLLLSDGKMSWRVILSAGDNGPFLRFLENDVNSRIGIGIVDDGSPGLELADLNGTSRVLLRLDQAGAVSLSLKDKDDRVRGSFEVSAVGDPSLALFDSRGETLAKLP
jgi:hypothetical protein